MSKVFTICRKWSLCGEITYYVTKLSRLWQKCVFRGEGIFFVAKGFLCVRIRYYVANKSCVGRVAVVGLGSAAPGVL